MVDVKNASNAGSPWDEPLDEVAKPQKPQPSVVGDLDFAPDNKREQKSTTPRTQPLKVPSDVEEKVGAKVEANKIVSPPASASVLTPESSAQAASPSRPAPVSAGPSPDGPAKAEGSDFWQSVYGQAAKDQAPTRAAGSTEKPAPISIPVVAKPENQPPAKGTQTTGADIRPIAPSRPAPPAPTVAVPALPTGQAGGRQAESNLDHLYQPAAAPIQAAGAQGVPPEPVEGPARSQPAGEPQIPLKGAPRPAPPVPQRGGSRTKVIILASILGLIVLFAGGVFLTEEGMISLGLEKIYGIVHLEALWKGLPENPENAFAMAATKMKTEKSFKVTGSATITVNRGVKSDIISPIVSAVASDNQSSLASSSMVASVEEVTAELSARIADDVSGAKIDLKSKKSPNSKIELVYSSGKMYLKSSDDIVYDKNVKGGWLAYNLKNFGQETPQDVLWGSDFSGSNFSIIGQRSGNETIDSVRCYHYEGKVTLGNALSSFGLNENSVSSMDVDFWLGVKDHLIHRLKMKIVSNSSAAVSRIEMTLDFSDYGGEGGDFAVPATSTPASGGTSQTSGTGQPTPSQATTATAEQLRDTQRKSDLGNIAKALESYFAAFGKYPITTKTEKISQTSGILYSTLDSTLVPTYITTLPIDPLDPKYYYGYESNGTQYTLSAVLEDRNDPDGKTVGSTYLYFLKSQ